jgi:hypothetical protein
MSEIKSSCTSVTNDILTIAEVAALLRVSRWQVCTLGIPCLDIGHRTKRYFRSDVMAWLEAQRRPARRAA